MEKKKNDKYNIDNSRGIILQIAIIISLLIVYYIINKETITKNKELNKTYIPIKVEIKKTETLVDTIKIQAPKPKKK